MVGGGGNIGGVVVGVMVITPDFAHSRGVGVAAGS
jgi:hypothetical protein